MSFKHVFKCLLVTIAFLPCSNAYAISDYRDAWQQLYPDSTADDITGGSGCQLCHVNPQGGAPWNAYGWDIRGEYRTNGFDINQAIETVELSDHDSDPQSTQSYDELLRGFQPGWTTGANNTFYNLNGSTTPNQTPPSLPATTALDPPAPVADPIAASIQPNGITLDLNEIASGFNAPVRAVKAPGIDGSLFVVEQTGKVFRVELASGEKSLFLDVGPSLVNINSSYDERGLLGLAFHPQFQANGLFYTYQSEPRRASETSNVDFTTLSATQNPNHRSMIVEYKAADPSCNSAISEQRNVLIIDQPQSNHNGGDLVFDNNGLLYIALGDGGGANDQGPGHSLLGTGRDNTNVLGSILRIDPLGYNVSGINSANGQYSTPTTNPFIGSGNLGIDEIFAFGFRNPYRMSLDTTTGYLYTGDVGQNNVEEIDLVISGGNYGWNWKEGSFSFYNPFSGNYVSNISPPNLPANLIEPIGEYDHDEGISVIGGYVYRGSELNSNLGDYIFGEFSGANSSSATGRILTLDLSTNEITEFSLATPIQAYVTGFGQDANQELYVVTNNQTNPGGLNGQLLQLVESGQTPVLPNAENESAQCQISDDLCFPVLSSTGNIALVCL